MSFAIAFWIIMLFWLLFALWYHWDKPNFPLIGGNLMAFILFLLLGWKTFGAPLHG